jgi:prevent-host-death family protein
LFNFQTEFRRRAAPRVVAGYFYANVCHMRAAISEGQRTSSACRNEYRKAYYDYGMMTMVVTDMKTIPAGSFKARCLALMDEVKAKRETVVITKHGKPVAKLVPVDGDTDEIFGFFSGKGSITGDVLSPVLSQEDWGNLG